jgi:hypothetical protein
LWHIWYLCLSIGRGPSFNHIHCKIKDVTWLMLITYIGHHICPVFPCEIDRIEKVRLLPQTNDFSRCVPCLFRPNVLFYIRLFFKEGKRDISLQGQDAYTGSPCFITVEPCTWVTSLNHVLWHGAKSSFRLRDFGHKPRWFSFGTFTNCLRYNFNKLEMQGM